MFLLKILSERPSFYKKNIFSENAKEDTFFCLGGEVIELLG